MTTPHPRAARPQLAKPRIVIGFAGRIGCGKTTAAVELYRYGFTRVRFAGPFKAMLRSLGLTEREIDGDHKELPCELLGGKTPRYAMQTLGSEWGRALIDPQLWLNAWLRSIEKVPPNVPIVADDVRFANEAAAIHAMGGVVIRVVRPSAPRIVGETTLHSSEELAFPTDQVLLNDGTPESFNEKLRMLAIGLTRSPPEDEPEAPQEEAA